jgi:hypothetical protein
VVANDGSGDMHRVAIGPSAPKDQVGAIDQRSEAATDERGGSVAERNRHESPRTSRQLLGAWTVSQSDDKGPNRGTAAERRTVSGGPPPRPGIRRRPRVEGNPTCSSVLPHTVCRLLAAHLRLAARHHAQDQHEGAVMMARAASFRKARSVRR